MSHPIERLVLQRVRALDPAKKLDAVLDLVVADGKIAELSTSPATKTSGPERHGEGLWVVPSFLDLRTRLGEPGFEYRETIESGLRAAAAGGFGAVAMLPCTEPVMDQAPVLESALARAREVDRSGLLPVASITRQMAGNTLTEFGELQAKGAVAFSDGDHYVASASVMRRALEYALSFDALIIQQPSEPSLTANTVMHEGTTSSRLGLRGCPRAAEEIALQRDLSLVRQTGGRYHASCLSTAEAIESIERAKAQGLPVTADVSVAHLLFSDEDLASYDPRFRCHPPFREPSDRAALLRAVRNGTIDAICSNHTPLAELEQDCEFDQAGAGINSLETCVAVLLELQERGELSLDRLILALSTHPARILGQVPPTLEVGAPANFTVLNPTKSWTLTRSELHSLSHNTPLLGRQLRGRVVLTVARGTTLFSSHEELA